MLTFRLHMTFTEQTRDEAAAALRSLVGPVRSEPGCSATRVHRGAGQSHEFTWVSEWRSIEDFERHLRVPTFRQIVAVIEMADGPPKVEIDDVNSRRGFELIEEILGRSPAENAGLEIG